MFSKIKNFSGIGQHQHRAEISHAFAGSFYAPNDDVSGHPASVHQNTEWLAIETGVKGLISNGVYPTVKVPHYVHDKTDPKLSGTLKAARFKIYLGGQKVFDHVAVGNRGNIDPDEANDLYNKVLSLGHLPQPSPFSLGAKLPKGIHGPAPDLITIQQNRTNSASNPMFTDISHGSLAAGAKREHGIFAHYFMEKLY